MKFCQNCEIWSKLPNLVTIVKFHQDCIRPDLSNLVWCGKALYGSVEILKLYVKRVYVGSERLSEGSGRLSVGSGWLSIRFGRLYGGVSKFG